MSLTKIGSIGINTGIQFAGVTTVSSLQAGAATTIHSTGIDLGSGNINSHNINSTGIITATSFVGSGSGLTGVASTDNIRTNTNATFLQNINVSGTSTIGGDVTVNGGDITIAKQNDAPTMTLLHDGTNPSTNDLLFRMQFQSDYNGSHQNWGKIELDTNASSVRTNMDFYVKSQTGNEQLALRLEGQQSTTPNAIFEGDVILAATKKLYLDGGGDSYIHEVAGDDIDIVAGGNNSIQIRGANTTFGGNLYIPEYIYHDGNTTTYARFQTNRLTLNSGGGAVVDLHSNGQLYFTGASTFYSNATFAGSVTADTIVINDTDSLSLIHI